MWIKSCISSLLENMLRYLGCAFHLNTEKAAEFLSYLAIAILGFLMENDQVSWYTSAVARGICFAM